MLLLLLAFPLGAWAAAAVPSLDELSAEWMDVSTLRNHPSVCNFIGGLKTTGNLTAFDCLTLPPDAQGGSAGELLLDGKPLAAVESRWLPYEVRRRTSVNGVTLESTIRMPFEQPGVLTRLTLRNNASEPRTMNLALECNGHIRQFEPQHWNRWDTPRPGDGGFAASVAEDGRGINIADNESPARVSWAFVQKPLTLQAHGEKGTAQWVITLAPGQKAELEYVFGIGKGVAARWAADFGGQFDAAKAQYQARWQAAFTPGNRDFSGHLPTLITEDARIRRVYYHGALVPLLMCRVNLPASRRCFVTAGPEWANTLMYFWDTEMWANLWAFLEPVTMKELVTKWLGMNLQACYALDCMSGKGAGPWYAANDWSVFRAVEAYLGVTGDGDFLKQPVADKTVLEHLERLATTYTNRISADSPLADYGGAENLLECAPSYIHRIPAYNGANVYMLQRVAQLLDRARANQRAAKLRAQADKLLPAVLDLYEPSLGVWNSLHRDGRKVQLRHCLDYIVIGQALENSLSTGMKSEMTAFVERELLTDTWMRAMSLKDPAAAKSDRPDHGPMGSYDGWPPLTMDVMCRFGDFKKAADFMRRTEAVTREGCFAQAHEFVGGLVRTAHRDGQDANEGCGAAFAEVVIRGMFGYRPDLCGDDLKLFAPDAPRGFTGQLLHVPYHGSLYTIQSDDKGVRATKE